MTTEKQSIEVLRCIRALQKRNRAVSSASGLRLSLLESHLLTEVEIAEETGVNDLAQILCIPKQEASRLTKRFIESGLLLSSSSSDKRFKPLKLSHEGKRIVDEVDARANPRLTEIFSCLSTSELKFFKRSIQLISDAAGVPPAVSRETEPVIRSEIRRLTRALTLLKSKVFGSSLHPTEWHILSELAEAKKDIPVSKIADTLRLGTATVSASLSKLCTKKCVAASKNSPDKRQRLYSISTVGRKTLSAAEASGAKIVLQGLKSYSKEDCERFLHLIDRVVRKRDSSFYY